MASLNGFLAEWEIFYDLFAYNRLEWSVCKWGIEDFLRDGLCTVVRALVSDEYWWHSYLKYLKYSVTKSDDQIT